MIVELLQIVFLREFKDTPKDGFWILKLQRDQRHLCHHSDDELIPIRPALFNIYAVQLQNLMEYTSSEEN